MSEVEFNNMVEVFIDLLKWKVEAEAPTPTQAVSMTLN